MFDFIRVNRKMYMDLLEDLRQAKETNLRVTEDKFNVEQNIQGLRNAYKTCRKELLTARKDIEDYRVKLLNAGNKAEIAERKLANIRENFHLNVDIENDSITGYGIALVLHHHKAGSPLGHLEDGVEYQLLLCTGTGEQYWVDCYCKKDDSGVHLIPWDETGEPYAAADEFWWMEIPDADDVLIPEKRGRE